MVTILGLKVEVEKLSEEVSRLASENISLKNKYFERVKKKTMLENEVRSLKEAIKIEIEGRLRAEAHIVKITENFEKELVDKFEKKTEELKKEVERLNGEVSELTLKNTALQDACKSYEIAIVNWQKKFENCKTDFTEFKKTAEETHQSYKASLREAVARNEELAPINTSLQESCKNYEIAVLNWQKKFQNKVAEKNAATKKLVELKKSIINLLIE